MPIIRDSTKKLSDVNQSNQFMDSVYRSTDKVFSKFIPVGTEFLGNITTYDRDTQNNSFELPVPFNRLKDGLKFVWLDHSPQFQDVNGNSWNYKYTKTVATVAKDDLMNKISVEIANSSILTDTTIYGPLTKVHVSSNGVDTIYFTSDEEDNSNHGDGMTHTGAYEGGSMSIATNTGEATYDGASLQFSSIQSY